MEKGLLPYGLSENRCIREKFNTLPKRAQVAIAHRDKVKALRDISISTYLKLIPNPSKELEIIFDD